MNVYKIVYHKMLCWNDEWLNWTAGHVKSRESERYDIRINVASFQFLISTIHTTSYTLYIGLYVRGAQPFCGSKGGRSVLLLVHSRAEYELLSELSKVK